MDDIPLARLLTDPSWFPHRLDADGRRIWLRRLDRAARGRASFLTDEKLGHGPGRWVDRIAAVRASPEPAPLRLILHSAFCCSTLLANALDLPGVAHSLKEPVILNDLVGWRTRGAAPRDVAEALDHALRLLTRPFVAGEAVVIKPSNLVNPLAPAMLALWPESRALMLHAPLRTFLASVASKGMWGRLWVRELAWKLLRGGVLNFGFNEEELYRQTDLQVAALGWLGQHRLFVELAEKLGPSRVATLDSETLLAHPSTAIEGVARLFGLRLAPGQAVEVATGPAFSRNAKTGEAFGPVERAAVHAGPAEANADEIQKVAVWAEAVAASASIPLIMPAPLLL